MLTGVFSGNLEHNSLGGRLYMNPSNKLLLIRTAKAVLEFTAGIMALILFRWTPETGRGICIYLGLLALAISLALLMLRLEKKNGGYWPEKPG
jgi:hypothetical protein